MLRFASLNLNDQPAISKRNGCIRNAIDSELSWRILVFQALLVLSAWRLLRRAALDPARLRQGQHHLSAGFTLGPCGHHDPGLLARSRTTPNVAQRCVSLHRLNCERGSNLRSRHDCLYHLRMGG